MMLQARDSFERFIRSPFGPIAVFVTLSFLLYGNSLFGEFVYDDAFFSRDATMRHVSYLWHTWFQPSLRDMDQYAHYRPLSFATFSLNFIFFGESSFWFHLASVILNGCTSWLVFLLVRRLFGHYALAWITALLFAFLPIHTEAVAYIKARDELLVAFFGLLAWLAFLRATTMQRQTLLWSLIAAVFSLAAFFSKESAVVLPGVLGGSLLLLHGWRGVWKARLPLALQAAAMIMFFGFLRVALKGTGGIPDIEILYFGQNPLGYMSPDFIPWTAAELFFIATSKVFVPWNLSATYGFNHVPMINGPLGSWMAIAGLLVLLMLVAFIVWPKTRRTPVGIGSLMFLTLYFPFSKIPFSKAFDLFAERWLYGPSIGLCMMGGYGAWMLWQHKRVMASVLCTGVIVAYLFVLLPRNMVWRNATALGESMVEDAPDAVISYVFLANDRIQYSRFDEAIDLVTKGLQITRYHIPLHHVAAVVALSLGRLDVADQAISEAESLGEELNNEVLRSTLLAKQGKFQESLDHIQNSQWFHEDDYRIRLLLALNYWRMGRREEAEQYLDWDVYLPEKLTREEKIQMLESY